MAGGGWIAPGSRPCSRESDQVEKDPVEESRAFRGPAANGSDNLPSRPSSRAIRILFLADSHLGFDMPRRPRVERRRRGPDFFRNFDLALRPARERKVDLVIHGGDLFFRSRVGSGLVMQVRERIRAVAESGIPILVVPGNHERSALPLPILWRIPGLSVFDRPRTFTQSVRGVTVNVSGFPCQRRRAREFFHALVDATGWACGPSRHSRRHPIRDRGAGIRILAMHQTVEGARVGPHSFIFRSGPDVIRGRDVPEGFAAVLSGHIHRHQVLRKDLSGHALASPVIYPGSTERTSFAERSEAKGYLILDLGATADGRGRLVGCRFVELPTSPMVHLELDVAGRSAAEVEAVLSRDLARLPPNSIVRVNVRGRAGADVRALLGAPALRRFAPGTMSIDLGAGLRASGIGSTIRSRP